MPITTYPSVPTSLIRASKTTMFENGVLYADATVPAVRKSMVLAETYNGPGTIDGFWFAGGDSSALNGTVNAWHEQGGSIQIYTDSTTAPVVDLTIGEFFGYYPLCDVFNAGVFGRVMRSATQSGAWRDLNIPFEKWFSVRLVNTTANDIPNIYGRASYTLRNTYNPVRRAYRVAKAKGSFTVRQPVTVTPPAGACKLESIFMHVQGGVNDDGLREGNWVVTDNGVEVWSASGGEDAINGAWYAAPIGGFPAGGAGISSMQVLATPQTGYCYYRHFPEPILISGALAVSCWLGQVGQGTVTSTTATATVHIGYSTTTPNTVNVLGPTTTTSFSDTLKAYPATIPAGSYNQIAGQTALTGSASGVSSTFGTTAAYQDDRATAVGYTLPANFWAQLTVQITAAQATAVQEAYLGVLGASPDSYFGSAIHVELVRDTAGLWTVRAKDDFNTVQSRVVGNGTDITGTNFDLAIKSVGGVVTTFYRYTGQTEWSTLSTWTSSKVGAALSFGAWTASALFTNLAVYTLA